MPPVNGTQWRHRRAQMDITSDQAAALLNIAGGALRQIETGAKPASLALAYRAARLYRCGVGELIAGNEGVPDEPPRQPKREPKGPVRRQEAEKKRTGSGPRRAGTAAAAS